MSGRHWFDTSQDYQRIRTMEDMFNAYLEFIAKLVCPIVKLYDKGPKAGLLETFIVGLVIIPGTLLATITYFGLKWMFG